MDSKVREIVVYLVDSKVLGEHAGSYQSEMKHIGLLREFGVQIESYWQEEAELDVNGHAPGER